MLDEEQSIQEADEAKENLKKVHNICTFFQKRGHDVSHCWTLHPTSHPKHMQQKDRKIGTSGTMDSIIDVKMEDSHEEVLQQQKSPWRWLGKKWMEFLTQ